MPAEYDLREGLNGNDKERGTLHPHIISKGTIDSKQIAKDIASATTFSEGEVLGLIAAYENKISSYLKEGYEVKMGEMGYFSLKLKARPVRDPKEIRAYSISINNVNFKASAHLKKDMRGVPLQRARYGFSKSMKISQEECRKRLLTYLESNPIIVRREYSAITGLLKNKALESLEEFRKEGLIEKRGRGSQVYYIKK